METIAYVRLRSPGTRFRRTRPGSGTEPAGRGVGHGRTVEGGRPKFQTRRVQLVPRDRREVSRAPRFRRNGVHHLALIAPFAADAVLEPNRVDPDRNRRPGLETRRPARRDEPVLVESQREQFVIERSALASQPDGGQRVPRFIAGQKGEEERVGAASQRRVGERVV